MQDEMRYLRRDDVRLAYRTVGSGMPLVITSGIGDSMGNWDESIITRLAQEYCVILPDSRGIGLTNMGAVHPQRMTIEQYAEDLFAILDAEGVTEMYLLGHSMGGMIAQEFALRHPEMVRKLMLFATDYGPLSSYRAHMMNRCVTPLRMLCTIAPWHTKGFRAGACAIASWDGTADRLGDILCETLLLVGDRDFLMHTDIAWEMHALIGGSHLKIIPGGTHRMHDLYPEEFTKIVLDFFGRETAEKVPE